MSTTDIFIGSENTDHFDFNDLASLYNCKVIFIDSEYATIEGDDTDIEQFLKFWTKRSLDNDQWVFWA